MVKIIDLEIVKYSHVSSLPEQQEVVSDMPSLCMHVKGKVKLPL
jgi:hypothetical protein